MASEKYIVATTENPVQIVVRNTLNPNGYTFLTNCNDPISLLRLIRSYQPDFVVVDTSMQMSELKNVLHTIDDEMLCACIVLGDYRDREALLFISESNVMTFCQKPINKEVFLNTVELSLLNYSRIFRIHKKLKEITDSFESRKAIERAKWILIERDGMSENEAYEKMRKKSMDLRLTMKAIAEAIIFTHEISEK